MFVAAAHPVNNKESAISRYVFKVMTAAISKTPAKYSVLSRHIDSA